MATHTYTGTERQVYPQYIDAAKGSTLVAEPGGTYELAPAQGVPETLPVPPDARWTKPTAPKTAKES